MNKNVIMNFIYYHTILKLLL